MNVFEDLHQRIAAVRQRELFFVVGAIKSGTTWVQKLLDGHPQMCCNGESHLGHYFAPALAKLLSQHNKMLRSKNRMLTGTEVGYPTFSREHLNYLLETAFCLLLDAQQPAAAPRFIGEKTPDHVRVLEPLAKMFPRAKFLHIIRDGRDCTVSAWFHIYRDSPEWARQRFPRFPMYVKVLSRTWARDVTAGRTFAREHPDRILEFRYEQLHGDTAGTVRRVLEFLGADAGDPAVQACVQAGSFRRLSGGRQRGQEDRGSHFRKGVVGDWREHFDAESLELFDAGAGELLRELGYA
jgi:hypothetical protein